MNAFIPTRIPILILLMICLVWTPVQAQESPPGEPALPPTRLKIPAIDLDTDITPTGWIATRGGTVWEVPEVNAGWLTTSLSPGRGGNVVLTGHHNIKGKVFRDLKDVKIGDRLTVYSSNSAFNYVVTQRMILQEALATQKQRQNNARWIGSFPDERVTLVTCWPSWTNTHRLIIVAEPADLESLRPRPNIRANSSP